MTSSLSGESYSSKVGSFSLGQPVNAFAVSNTIFEIKANKEKTNISTFMLSGSNKKLYPLVFWLQAPHQKTAVAGLLIITTQVDQEVISFDHQKGEVNLIHCPKSRQGISVVSNW